MSLKTLPKTEPVALVSSALTAFHAILAFLVTQGTVHLSVQSVVQLEAAVAAVVAVPVTLFVRSIVTPNSNIKKEVA